MILALLLVVLVAFSAFTGQVVAADGYFGFLAVAAQGGWGLQVFLDLVIALVLFAVWMIPDARARRLPWPVYFAAVLFLGSIGAILYLIHRELVARRGAPAIAPA